MAFSLNDITFKSFLRSRPVRENFENIVSEINSIQDQINLLTTPPIGSEVPNSRPYHSTLKERLDSIRLGQYPYVKKGGIVTINGTDPQKIDVAETECSINGIDTKSSATTSNTILYTSSGSRYDVVVQNYDSTISIVSGSQSSNPILPSILSTQRALWIITITTTTISLGWDARSQGVIYLKNGNWNYRFLINDALSDIGSSGGYLRILDGQYRESTINISNNNIYLHYSNNAYQYQPSASSRILNITGDDITIDGGIFNNILVAIDGVINVTGSNNVIIKNVITEHKLGHYAIVFQSVTNSIITGSYLGDVYLNLCTSIYIDIYGPFYVNTVISSSNYYIKTSVSVYSDIEIRTNTFRANTDVRTPTFLNSAGTELPDYQIIPSSGEYYTGQKINGQKVYAIRQSGTFDSSPNIGSSTLINSGSFWVKIIDTVYNYYPVRIDGYAIDDFGYKTPFGNSVIGTGSVVNYVAASYSGASLFIYAESTSSTQFNSKDIVAIFYYTKSPY